MENVTISENLFVQEPKKEQLFQLFEEVFDISVQTMQNFDARGFWDQTYKPVAYMQGEQVIANVSSFSLPLFVNGEFVNAAGIQSVMTHPDYRGKGLMKQLFCEMLQKIDEHYECAMLFTEKPELYEAFGFQVVKEHLMTLSYDKTKHKTLSLQKLNFSDEEDLQLIKEKLENSQPLSNMFSTLNYQSSFYFNMYDTKWNEKLYYSKKLDALFVYEVKDQTLKLFGVFASVFPILDEICAEIPEVFTEIEFYFYPDELGIEKLAYKEFQSDKYLMVRSSNKIHFNGYKFPILTEF
ncbi:GNAT family N-acetyltransferase [Bacillus gaemokensis]|uniref:Acetyltransferase n=1 Tax=Bacillus gaemokensis TaxID=574375 RepID=A0A073K893_9BACI|nr:GNAT family N-acetyltransferase [Bacillus gaemokensis]KEK23499.1 acetyltransferase [Bacillus gaemokensis]KYG27132.1 acetyltransferase [Bacillus gaemokensis]